MLSSVYQLRSMQDADYSAITEICACVYPADEPYTVAELAEHHRRFPEGQLVAEHVPTGAVAGVHFTLRLRFEDFHVDDPWDVLTDHGTFDDDDPTGHTLYGADIMVSPNHQHHSLAHALTDSARTIVVEQALWRMVGGSRLPGYGAVCQKMSALAYVEAVVAGTLVDPVLTVHLKDGWQVVRPIQGYLQHDPESAGWAVVIQWVNPNCPPPAGLELK